MCIVNYYQQTLFIKTIVYELISSRIFQSFNYPFDVSIILYFFILYSFGEGEGINMIFDCINIIILEFFVNFLQHSLNC